MIAVVVAITFFSVLSLLYFFTWHLGSDWGRFSDHWPSLWQSVKLLLSSHSVKGWEHYWQQINDYGWTVDFVIHAVAPLLAASIGAYTAGRLFYFPGGRDGLQHIAGPRLYWHNCAIQHAKQRLKLERRDHPQPGLKLHPEIAIPRVRESGNIFVAGAQGTGKTIFIKPLIQQVIERGERAFIYDEKREFTSLFFNPQTCILIAPWDRRSKAWSISADASNATRAQLIAERLIPDSDDPLWSNGARMIFTGVTEILNNTSRRWGWLELASTLSLDEKTLNNLLAEHFPRAARFIAENSKTTQSFFAQLLGSLGWIYTLADAWPRAYQNGFSMTQWVQQADTDKPVILVQADKRFKDIGAPVANALIALMTSNILAQTNTTTRELWLFLDELANLPRNESLLEWMSLGRSKGCRLVAGTQSISQLQQLYSERGADSLLNMFTVFASMRVGAAGETATYTAKAFGEREVERPTSSAGPEGAPITNWHHETQALVNPSDLVQLPQAGRRGAEGYLLIPGWQAVYRLLWPVPNLLKHAPEHCPASWLTQAPRPSPSTDKSTPAASRRDQLRRRRHAVNEFD
ncbi:type IV secretion system DNA-binding domain-containing protein [Marinobacter sp. M-5]|uniref:type IV secretion system DNA-binding domain-containing protein n=1 Tax=Marinobacter sp. M-5 TaxID=3081089 RepID=UPI00293C73F9|nr:type IV secretion system DNA-binding domain-containing protein [Marinobacter sp. M-5]MDV3502526.1 type IV secretion system DNA-binding domain-containing protein [Marinobacter sp. M-5]